MTNKAITDLLCPMATQYGEFTESDIQGSSNAQVLSIYSQLTCTDAQSLYTKSRDLQNIAPQNGLQPTVQRDIKFKLCSWKDTYRFQNTSNRTIEVTLIEYSPKRFTDYEIEDTWGEDLQMQFGIEDNETTPNGTVRSTTDIGAMPFNKRNRNTNGLFRQLSSKKAIIEPGQTLIYDLVHNGSTINVNDYNFTLTESGTAPQYAPYTKFLMVISNGQLVQDSTTGATGFGVYSMGVIRKRSITYRAALQQQSYFSYRDADTDYAAISSGVAMNPTDETIDATAQTN
ncbi:hypothetical protein [Shewanella sp.]|uniref:hypothetical protein n=1 Tax=Shewanella sp. TaxID=50422 RepID=UPI0040488B6E